MFLVLLAVLQRKKTAEAEAKAKKMAGEAEEKIQRLKKEVGGQTCRAVLLIFFPVCLFQLAHSTDKHEKRFSNLTTPSISHVKEGATDDQEEGQMEGTTDFTLEGVANVGSELERVHIAEKNKAMAAKLKVRFE